MKKLEIATHTLSLTEIEGYIRKCSCITEDHQWIIIRKAKYRRYWSVSLNEFQSTVCTWLDLAHFDNSQC